MKPRNKFQKHLVQINKSLPEISPAQERYAQKHCLFHKAVRLKSGKITCLDCGHSWQSDFKVAWPDKIIKQTCPNCKTKVDIEQTRHRVFTDKNYLTILTTHKGFQVIRKIYIKAYYKSGQKVRYYSYEVSRIYIAPNGKYGIIGNGVNYYSDNWFGDFTLRHNKTINKHDFNTKVIYPYKRYIPEIIRNGFKGKTYDIRLLRLLYGLLTKPKAETLFKAGQIGFFLAITDDYYCERVSKYWSSIKICMRNNYIVKNSRDWFDYLELLDYFGKDLRNAKYVCPVNLDKEHNKYVERKRKILLKEKTESMKKDLAKAQKAYSKIRKPYFGLTFKEDNITVKVIKSVKKVLEFGDRFHHCIFVNEYHKKKRSLLLYASVDNTPIETIEFDLNRLEVVQSRGYLNKSSDYTNQIIDLVNNHRNEIKRIAV